jgi:hypothetical protein
VFFAKDGDCLLLSSSDQQHVLIDGGRASTFDTALESIRAIGRNHQLDLVIVTHIDVDHIAGVLKLMEHYLPAREPHDKRMSTAGLHSADKDMPAIAALWHNSWEQQVGGELAARVRPVTIDVNLLQGMDDGPAIGGPINFAQPFGPEKGEALLQLVDTKLSTVSRNHGFPDDLVALNYDAPHTEWLSDRFSLAVLGPSHAALKILKDWWANELENDSVSTPPAGLAEYLEANGFGGSISDADAASESSRATIAGAIALPLGEIGDEAEITVPNRASIIVLAEERHDDRTFSCLLTGDAASSDILDGLRARGILPDGGKFRCDIVKFQHHGAEFNYTDEFARTVIGRHYVFCANGRFENPDHRIMPTLISLRAKADPGTKFTLWFNCPVDYAPPTGVEVMQAALDAAVEAANKVNEDDPGLVTVRVLRGDKLYFDICLGDCADGDDCVSPDDVTTVLVGDS